MSIEVMSQVWKLELEPAHRIVLLALADHAHDDGTHVFPSIEYTAWKTGYSEAQTRRIIKALVKSEILSSTPRPGKTNLYAIHVEKGKRKSPFKPLQDDTPTPNASVPKSEDESSVESLVKESTPENGVGRKPNPWYDAVKATWGYEAGKNGSMVAMLQGRATKAMRSDWHLYNLTVEISPDEVLKWAAWYRATKLHGDAKMNLCEKHDEVQSSITAWVNLGKPSAIAIATDPLAGITVIRAGA